MKQKPLPLLILLVLAIAVASCKKKEKDNLAPGNNTGGTSLLSGAETGSLTASLNTINDFSLAFNDNSAVLVLANNTAGKIYAVDLKDNDASQAATNSVSGSVNDFAAKIAGKMGTSANNVELENMEVNPISKALYVLARNGQNNARMMFRITNGGNDVNAISFDNVSYATITFSTNNSSINDMTWGDNTLYFSFSHASTLNGEVATVKAPFVHNSTAASRATTVFKSNWGGNFFTDAPLETMTYGEIGGEKRLVGVTVCAPGFSLKTADIGQGSGLLQVNEYFNLNTGMPVKVFCANTATSSYMFEVHENGRLVRIGKAYLDGSKPSNNNSRYVLDLNSQVQNGIAEEDLKVVMAPGNCMMAAKYSDTKILTVNAQGKLALTDI